MDEREQLREKNNLKYYCECFVNIQVYRSGKKGGDALNQPILVLSVIDAISQGIIRDNRIQISEELIDIFKKYWSILCTSPFKSSDFALPFFHLKNGKKGKYKFWHLKFSADYEGGRPQSIPKLRHDVDYAYLDEELYKYLQQQDSRDILIENLISNWFSSTQKPIEDILQINQDFQDYTDEVENEGDLALAEDQPKFYLRKSVVRKTFFRKSIVNLYDFRCAFCRLQIKHSLSQSVVDGAHIKPFAEFYDNSIPNGIALCKNHHWAFDSGLFTLNDNYKIVVSGDFREESPHARAIRDFQGETILLPDSSRYYPNLESLRWHRQNKFRA